MVDPSQIREHLEVVGSDGGHVGRVDHVLGDQIEQARLDLAGGFKHHLIPVSRVDHVDEHMHLNLTRDEARARWTGKHQPPAYREFTKAPLLSTGPSPI